MRKIGIILVLVGLALLLLTMGNTFGIIYPPIISETFEGWFFTTLVGIIAFISGVMLSVK